MADLDDAKHLDRAGLTAIIWACFGIATIFVASRIFFRLHCYRCIKWDDAWIVLAWTSTLVMCILAMVQQNTLWETAETTGGQADSDGDGWTQSQLRRLDKWQFASMNLFWVVSSFKTRRIIWLFITTTVLLAFIGCLVASSISCHAHSGCTAGLDLYRQKFSILFSTALDIATNLLIVALPLSVLPLVNLDTRKKLAMGFMFTLSLLVVCVSILRMTQVVVDADVDLVGLMIWSTVETCTALIIGSLPPFSGLLSRRIGNIRTNQANKTLMENDFNPQKSYPLYSRALTITTVEPGPVPDPSCVAQAGEGIFVQRTFESRTEEWQETNAYTASSEDGSTYAMVRFESDTTQLTRI
ncbi:hypothetical protein NLG97_g9400 [Lecanicillium saksenae]|uniref:Uncharacterized protein n=1 Tax=Lecanicillium saksenae TaxID=468837 RepID=A0ACC1QK31_9HYPO|nr:hypothetical protein NLG97_g9400 [Lecanicillium saksenae]